MATKHLPNVRTIDVAMLTAGAVQVVRIENPKGIADLCALVSHLQDNNMVDMLEDGRDPANPKQRRKH